MQCRYRCDDGDRSLSGLISHLTNSVRSTYSTYPIYKSDGIGTTDAPKNIFILMRDCHDVLSVLLPVLDPTFIHTTLASGNVLQRCC